MGGWSIRIQKTFNSKKITTTHSSTTIPLRKKRQMKMGTKRSLILRELHLPLHLLYAIVNTQSLYCQTVFLLEEIHFLSSQKLHKPTGKQPIFYVRNRYLKVHDVRAHLYC